MITLNKLRYHKVSCLVDVVKILEFYHIWAWRLYVAGTILTFLSKAKEWPSYHNLLRLPKQIWPCRKKVQDQPKVTIWTYLVVLKFLIWLVVLGLTAL